MASGGDIVIGQRQNMEENLDLLAAQRRLYSDAKMLRSYRTVVSLVVAIPLPVVAVLVPTVQPFATAVGGIWLLVALLLQFGFEQQRAASATHVLEQFDVSVFGLDWNHRLAGKRVPPEVIANAVRRFRESRENLRDWYPVVSDLLPYPISVLLCQRAAVAWDWRLRRTYAWLIVAMTLLLALAAIVASLVLKYTLAQTFLVFFLPMASAFTAGISASATHFLHAHDQQEMQDRLDEDWERVLAEPESLTVFECRQHQDARFTLRMKTLPIPDWWYRRWRGRQEADMREATKRMVAEFERTTKN